MRIAVHVLTFWVLRRLVILIHLLVVVDYAELLGTYNVVLAGALGLIAGEEAAILFAIGALLGLLVLHEGLVFPRNYLLLIIDEPNVDKPIHACHVSPDLLSLVLYCLQSALHTGTEGTLYLINLRARILQQGQASFTIPVFIHERAEVLGNKLAAIARLMHSNLAQTANDDLISIEIVHI